MLLTFQDAVERLVDYLGAQPADNVLRDAKAACIEALRDLTQSFTWTYLYTQGRVQTVAPFSDGLITYSASNESYPNQVTLAGASWPSWAALGTLRVGSTGGDLNYDVDRLISGTILTLRSPLIPADDITTPSAFGLYRDSYSLPDDFVAQDTTFSPEFWGGLSYVHPREWLAQTSRWGLGGNPVAFTIMADPDYGGRLALKLAPYPQTSCEIDFIYKRRPNPLTIFQSSGGTVQTAAGSRAVQGAGTAFTSAMAGGTVIRLSGNAKPPTPVWGANPAVFETKLVSVAETPQVLTLYDPVPTAFTNAFYTISSWIDITVGTMTQAFSRCAEHHISMSRVLKDKPSARLAYERALEIARCADSRANMPRAAGIPGSHRLRLRDFPLDLRTES